MAKLLGPTRKHASNLKIRNVQGEYEFLKYDSRRALRRLLSCRTSSIRNCRCSGIGDAAARGPAGAQGLSSKSTGLRFRNHFQLDSVLAALTDLENEVQIAKGLSNGFGLGLEIKTFKSCPSLRCTIGAPQPAYLPHRNCAASCPGPADILTQRRQLPLPLPSLNTPCICRWLRRPGLWHPVARRGSCYASLSSLP